MCHQGTLHKHLIHELPAILQKYNLCQADHTHCSLASKKIVYILLIVRNEIIEELGPVLMEELTHLACFNKKSISHDKLS